MDSTESDAVCGLELEESTSVSVVVHEMLAILGRSGEDSWSEKRKLHPHETVPVIERIGHRHLWRSQGVFEQKSVGIPQSTEAGMMP